MGWQNFSLPDWLPWWAVVALLVPVAFYLALFLLMPLSTFGLRAKLRDIESRLDALHEEIRALTLRLPERGDHYDEPHVRPPPIPPAPREAGSRDIARDATSRDAPASRGAGPRGTLGDPVADRMLAYLRDKAQSDFQRGEARPPRPRNDARSEPRLTASRPAESLDGDPTPQTPPVMQVPMPPIPPEDLSPPLPPRVPNRLGRRPDTDPPDSRIDWPR